MSERLTILFDKHLAGQLTANERVELMGLFLEPALQLQLLGLVETAWAQTGEEQGMPEEKKQLLFQKIFEPVEEKVPVIEMAPQRKTGWKRWVAAAAVLLIVALGTYLIGPGRKNSEPIPQTVINDVKAPKSNRAMITLADGRKVYLDSADNGQLALQGNVKLVKLDNGQIAYQTETGAMVKEPRYNTLSNPRGSKVINMTLADSSRVWLNAGSSVTYPVAFTGSERKVMITGEAYFEVTHDASRPFIVNKGKVNVTVLGTHFNVNAYEDEAAIRVTLIEGKVRVNETMIKPGEQAVIADRIKVLPDVDIEAVMAWKNGKFQFGDKTDIETVMRDVARWYDVEVAYQGTVNLHFWGSVSRDANISQLLKMLEATGGVTFKIEGKKITVMP